MRVRAKVKSSQQFEKVEWDGELLLVCVNAPATEGKANNRVCEVVAKAFGITKTEVKVAAGKKSNYKTLEFNRDVDFNFLVQ